VYHQRYVEKVEQPASFERDFGTAVHAGLEAYFRQQDYEIAFMRSWRDAQKEFKSAGVRAPLWLSVRGLELIEMVRARGLSGDPEQRVGITLAGISVPIIGYADLVSDGVIYDFKTTGWGWTQDHADREMFQPVIYSHAYAEAHGGIYPQFKFLILPRNGDSGLVELDGTRSIRQMFETFERMRQIHRAIEAQDFGCRCGGKYCMPVKEAA
jgi:hypothetical protein